MKSMNYSLEMDISVKNCTELIAKKAGRWYTDRDEDFYESDHEFLKRVASNYRSLVKLTTRYHKWVTINMERNGHLLDEDAVFAKIVSAVEKFSNELGEN